MDHFSYTEEVAIVIMVVALLYKFVPSEEAIYILLVYIFYFCSLFCFFFVGNSIKCKVNFVATFLFLLPIANRRKYEMRNENPKRSTTKTNAATTTMPKN